MRTVRYTKQFKKDYKRIKRQGKSPDKLKQVVQLLAQDAALPDKCRDHALIGNYAGARECHIEPDWLLIYQYGDFDDLILIRTGRHSHLF